jgi:two-component system, NarL family, response regulator YdfI
MEQGFSSPGGLGALTEPIRVLIVASSVVMQTGLATLLASEPDLDVVSQSPTGLVAELEQLQPEVVLLAGDSGQELSVLLAEINEHSDTVGVVALTDEVPAAELAELLRLGLRGILPRTVTPGELIGAITAVAAGLTVLHPELFLPLVLELPSSPPTAHLPSQTMLTSREVEVLRMLAEGLGNKTIARKLEISEHTVKFHISSIFSKLNASSRTEAVMLGARQGLVLL